MARLTSLVDINVPGLGHDIVAKLFTMTIIAIFVASERGGLCVCHLAGA